MLLTRFAKNMFNLQLGASILGALCVSILVPSCASPSCTTLHWLSLCQTEVFHKGSPKLQGSIFFAGLGGTIFKTLKGDIMSGPPRDVFSVVLNVL